MKHMGIAIILMLLLTLPYSFAGSVLDDAEFVFVGSRDYIDSVPLASYSLMALSSMLGKVENATPLFGAIVNITGFILSVQNQDGGWGYRANEVSTPQDTALALIALNYAREASEKFGVDIADKNVKTAIARGKSYLLLSYSGPGWGYVAHSRTEFYPTALSLWALGLLGLNYTNPKIKAAADYIANFTHLSPEFEALRLLAFHSVGYPEYESYLDRCRSLLNGQLTPGQRAMLTYAVLLYEPISFTIGRSLTLLSELGDKNGTYILPFGGTPFMSESNLKSTAFAVMSFSLVSDVSVRSSFDAVEKLYNELLSSQNPDGSWSLGYFPSSKATYYALLGLTSVKGYPRAAVQRAVDWAWNNLGNAMETAERLHSLTEEYYYTALILAEFGNLTPTERSKLVNFTLSLEVGDGLWAGIFAIPQPYQTALGLNLLLALNYSGPEVRSASNWLLSISPSGWGIRLNNFLPATTGMDVSITATVLEALSKTVPPSKLKPHVDWLLYQRSPSGTWTYTGREKTLAGEVIYGQSSLFLTLKVVLLLKSLGYDYSNEILPWVLETIKNNKNLNPLEAGLSLKFLSGVNLFPQTTLYEVVRAILRGGDSWEVDSSSCGNFSKSVAMVLSSYVQVSVSSNLSPTKGNHVIIACPWEVNVSRYNPYVNVSLKEGHIIVDGMDFPLNTTLLVIPGRTSDGGYVLLFLGTEGLKAVPVLFEKGMWQYLHGHCLVLSVIDKNHDGVIQPEEITPLRMR